jgi:hypothetical protein
VVHEWAHVYYFACSEPNHLPMEVTAETEQACEELVRDTVVFGWAGLDLYEYALRDWEDEQRPDDVL